MSFLIRRSLLAIALTAVAPLAGIGITHAQSSDAADNAMRIDNPVRARIDEARRAAEAHKAHKAGLAPGELAAATPAQAALYPQATRPEPAAKATAQSTPTLQKIVAAYNAQDAATVTSLADGVIADPKSNAYDRAFSARMAGVALLQSNPAKSSDYLKQALQFNGLGNNDHYQTMSVLAQLQVQAGRYSDALATLDQLFNETHSQQPELLALKGNALYRLDRYPEAAAALKLATAGAPQPHADWMQLLMGAYAAAKQPAEAARVADALATQFPNDKNVQMNLAAVYMQGGENDKAAAVLEKLRASGQLSDEKDYHNLYALYSNVPGKEKQAIEVINEGLAKGVLKPDYENYLALAQAYYLNGQTTQSIDAYRKAAPLAPDGEAYLNLARALANAGKPAEAKQAAQQALAKGVKDPAQARKLIGQKGK